MLHVTNGLQPTNERAWRLVTKCNFARVAGLKNYPRTSFGHYSAHDCAKCQVSDSKNRRDSQQNKTNLIEARDCDRKFVLFTNEELNAFSRLCWLWTFSIFNTCTYLDGWTISHSLYFHFWLTYCVYLIFRPRLANGLISYQQPTVWVY